MAEPGKIRLGHRWQDHVIGVPTLTFLVFVIGLIHLLCHIIGKRQLLEVHSQDTYASYY